MSLFLTVAGCGGDSGIGIGTGGRRLGDLHHHCQRQTVFGAGRYGSGGTRATGGGTRACAFIHRVQ
ncbi:MAG: hypothetical protein IH802_12845 [Nitrospinae bacterium]|nr:hypothetical protein [Nitrospinota bacterium]